MARAALCAALILASAPAAARTFTVDDLLAQEQVGAAAFDPQGRWAVFERQGPYDQGVRFDLGQSNVLSASRLMIAPADGEGAARPWLTPDPGPGQVFGAFSPSGERAAIFQLRGDRWRLGVVTTATGATAWQTVAPEALWYGRSIAWLNDRELLVLTRTEPGLPVRLGEPGQSPTLLPPLWARAAKGELAVTANGSGRFVAVRPRPKARRLLQVDVGAGLARIVAEGEITDFEVAPDGRTVAIREAGPDLQAWPGRALHGDWGMADQVERLALVDLASGRRTVPCPTCDVLDSLLSWSPDGGSLLIYARGDHEPWSAGGFWRFDRSGRTTRLTAPPFQPEMQLRPERVQAGWLAGDPVVLGLLSGEASAWFRLGARGPVRLGRRLGAPGVPLAADATGLTVLSGARLWRLDPEGGARRIGPDHDLGILRTLTVRDGRQARAWSAQGWVIEEDGAVAELLRADRTVVSRVAHFPSGAAVLAAGRSQALIRHDREGGVGEVALNGPPGRVRTLATLNGRLADVDALDVRPVAHVGPDGRALRSWLFLPRRPPGAPAPPLVVKVYSGDVYRDWPRPKPPVQGFVADVRVLVGHGYAVLTPSLPLPDRQPQEPAAGLADRILAIVDAAARAPELQGLFDSDRLALVGQSYGGYTVGATLTQTARFRAAVAQSGYFDLVSEWAGLSLTLRARPDPGLRSNGATGGMESAQGRMGGPPWTDAARYARNSPLLAADRITTPLLLLHGDQDGNVDLGQSEALFSALYRQGKDAMLVTYWGEGHNIASPGNVRDLYARMFDFLDAHLSAARDLGSAHPTPASANSAPTPPSPPR